MTLNEIILAYDSFTLYLSGSLASNSYSFRVQYFASLSSCSDALLWSLGGSESRWQ